jgi:hypothetical protein
VAAFQATLSRNSTLTQVLARAAAVDLPGWHLVAGCLYQTVWNVVTGQPPGAGILDYDLAYFDGAGSSWDAEDAVIWAGQTASAGLPAPVQTRNQARVHLWYEQKSGIPCPAYSCTQAAIDTFEATTACPRHPPATRRPPGRGRASPCPGFPGQARQGQAGQQPAAGRSRRTPFGAQPGVLWAGTPAGPSSRSTWTATSRPTTTWWTAPR